MTTLIMVRGDTTDNWLAADPVLGERELTFDTTAGMFKVGNGTSKWSLLPYVGAPAGGVLTINGAAPDEDGNLVVTKSTVGLSNVNNTTDAQKPVSTLQAQAIAAAAVGSTLGEHVMLWDDGEWNYRGAVVTARPNVAPWPDAWVRWDTRSSTTFVNPPPMAIAYDKWEYNKNIIPVSS